MRAVDSGRGSVVSQTEPGLRLRMNRVLRQIEAQHRHLGPIYQALGEALARGVAEPARSAFQRYHEAIDAHFELEEQFFYPALHGLHPEITAGLEELGRDHRRFLEQARRIEALLLDGDIAHGSQQLDVFADELREHEAREERLVASLAKYD